MQDVCTKWVWCWGLTNKCCHSNFSSNQPPVAMVTNTKTGYNLFCIGHISHIFAPIFAYFCCKVSLLVSLSLTDLRCHGNKKLDILTQYWLQFSWHKRYISYYCTKLGVFGIDRFISYDIIYCSSYGHWYHGDENFDNLSQNWPYFHKAHRSVALRFVFFI